MPTEYKPIPSRFMIDGRIHFVMEIRENIYHRVLVMPALGNPRWLSNDQVNKILEEASNAKNN